MLDQPSHDNFTDAESGGYFIQPESVAEAMQEMTDLASPVGAFVREWCEVKTGLVVPVAELFEAWQYWCQSQGRDRSTNRALFGRDLRAAVPGNQPVPQAIKPDSTVNTTGSTTDETFTVTFRAEGSGPPVIIRLRRVLKFLLRSHGLRATEVSNATK